MYLDILCEIWEDGPVPDDATSVAQLIGENPDYFAPFWPGIRALLAPAAGGGLVSTRLEEERSEAIEISQSLSIRGQKGAEARWGRRKDASGNATAIGQAKPADAQSHTQAQTQHGKPSPAPARVMDAPKSWGAARLSDQWVEVVKKTPTGNYQVLVEAADRIARSAEARSTTVETHAVRLLQSFGSLVDGWRKAKRPTPQMSVEAFVKHFAACEEVIDGERDPNEEPKTAEPPKRGPKPPREAIPEGQGGEVPIDELLAGFDGRPARA